MTPSLSRSAPRPTPNSVQLGSRELAFGARTYVMGIVNVTPDSFSDGGLFTSVNAAVEHALELVEAGADIVDIGGESTRPGAAAVDEAQELERVIPVIEALRARSEVTISVDTYKSVVATHAVAAGAEIVNDISGLGFDKKMAQVVASTGAALVLMHIRGTPETMQRDLRPIDIDIIDEMLGYFRERIDLATQSGVASDQIIIDPGIGFGKTLAQNYQILAQLSRLTVLGRPILLGTSRKSFIGKTLDKAADERLMGTAATVACGLMAGADIVRVHDVAQMLDVVRVTEAICGMSRDHF